MIHWEQIYEAEQEDDLIYITQVLFQIDAAVNKHLDSCKLAKAMDQVNDQVLCASEAQDWIEAYNSPEKYQPVFDLSLMTTQGINKLWGRGLRRRPKEAQQECR